MRHSLRQKFVPYKDLKPYEEAQKNGTLIDGCIVAEIFRNKHDAEVRLEKVDDEE